MFKSLSYVLQLGLLLNSYLHHAQNSVWCKSTAVLTRREQSSVDTVQNRDRQLLLQLWEHPLRNRLHSTVYRKPKNYIWNTVANFLFLMSCLYKI